MATVYDIYGEYTNEKTGQPEWRWCTKNLPNREMAEKEVQQLKKYYGRNYKIQPRDR